MMCTQTKPNRMKKEKNGKIPSIKDVSSYIAIN